MDKSLSEIEKKLKKKDAELLKEYIEDLLKASNEVRINDLWNTEDGVRSYWIILINGVNDNSESDLTKSILFWKEFFAQGTAKVRCIQSSDKSFNYCMNTFEVNSCPTIVFSESSDFESFTRVDTELISAIQKKENGLQKFFTHIHSLIIREKSLNKISRSILSQKFWNYFDLVYKEIKGLVSINIDANKD